MITFDQYGTFLTLDADLLTAVTETPQEFVRAFFRRANRIEIGEVRIVEAAR